MDNTTSSRIYRQEFSWRVRCNAPPENWRQRLAGQLRKLAARIDGREAQVIEIDTRPALHPSVSREIVAKGVAHMERCLVTEMRLESIERLLGEALPSLFGEEARALEAQQLRKLVSRGA